MTIISKSQLLSFRNQYEKTASRSKARNLIFESKERKSKSYETTVFLSHKHNEIEELEAAIIMLKKIGVFVYVDWLDHDMPSITNPTTAAIIKERIKNNDRFILLATEGAINSKWCNWELGYGDSHKYLDEIALFPIKDEYTDWGGSEYLEIYPILSPKNHRFGPYEIEYPDGKKVKLEDWLS